MSHVVALSDNFAPYAPPDRYGYPAAMADGGKDSGGALEPTDPPVTSTTNQPQPQVLLVDVDDGTFAGWVSDNWPWIVGIGAAAFLAWLALRKGRAAYRRRKAGVKPAAAPRRAPRFKLVKVRQHLRRQVF